MEILGIKFSQFTIRMYSDLSLMHSPLNNIPMMLFSLHNSLFIRENMDKNKKPNIKKQIKRLLKMMKYSGNLILTYEYINLIQSYLINWKWLPKNSKIYSLGKSISKSFKTNFEIFPEYQRQSYQRIQTHYYSRDYDIRARGCQRIKNYYPKYHDN